MKLYLMENTETLKHGYVFLSLLLSEFIVKTGP